VTDRPALEFAGLLRQLRAQARLIQGELAEAVRPSFVAEARGRAFAEGVLAAMQRPAQAASWACGAIGLAAVPVTFLLVRRHELAIAVASESAKPQPASAEV
jgi:hypothetical protein